MEISTVRDLVISILCGLSIVLVIGLFAAFVIAYLKMKRLLSAVNQTIRSIHRCLAYIRGLSRGLNESLGIFKKESG
jgi:hypothetical protein